MGTPIRLKRSFDSAMLSAIAELGHQRRLLALIEVLPRFSDKRQAVAIASEIQQNIGGYLLTITVMNTLVGMSGSRPGWRCSGPDWAIRSFGVPWSFCSIMCRSWVH